MHLHNLSFHPWRCVQHNSHYFQERVGRTLPGCSHTEEHHGSLSAPALRPTLVLPLCTEAFVTEEMHGVALLTRPGFRGSPVISIIIFDFDLSAAPCRADRGRGREGR